MSKTHRYTHVVHTMIFTEKGEKLYETGWGEGEYTDFGKLIVGYLNTTRSEREKYFKILKRIPRDDMVKSHLLACHTANDMFLHPEQYGQFGYDFLNLYKQLASTLVLSNNEYI